MKVFQSLEEAQAGRSQLRRPVVTLGVFDGVHIGHRCVIDHVISLAQERAGDSVVVTFGRHPKAVIEDRAPKLITSLPHRLRIFEQLGVSATLVLSFDESLRSMEAEAFAGAVFGEALAAEIVILGYNNRFGRGGRGDISLLKELGPKFGFEARQVEELRLGDQIISSTEIRRAILEGDLDRAALMLGRPVSVLGTVERGDGIGRTLGWPTANLDLHHEVRPPRGVYGCMTEVDGQPHYGLVNLGVRPTVSETAAGGPTPSEALPAADLAAGPGWEARDRLERVEVHLLDFQGDLYGQDLEVRFLTRLRDELRFDGLDALKAQIAKDELAFRAWLSQG